MDGTWVTYEDAEITDPISGKRVIKQRLSPEFKPVWHDAGIYSYSTVEKRPGYNKDKKQVFYNETKRGKKTPPEKTGGDYRKEDCGVF